MHYTLRSLCRKLAGALLCVLFNSALAQPVPIELSADSPAIAIEGSTSYLLDEGGQLTLQEVRDREFLPLPGGQINFGFTPDHIWLRFQVSNLSGQSLQRLVRTSARFMRPLELYRVDAAGNATRLLYFDETSPFGARPLPELRFLAQTISLEANELATFYIRFAAGGQAAMSVDIAPRETALQEQFRASIGITIYTAILGTLILVNFFHYIAVRKLAYLVYVFYETFNIAYVAHIEGFTFQYLWPNLPQLNADATPLIAAAGIVVGNVFAMVFLEARRFAPRLAWGFYLLILLAVLSFIATLLINSRAGNQLSAPLLPVSLFLSVITAAVALRRGHEPARYFLVAWSLFAMSGLFWSGAILGWFSVEFNTLTLYKATIAAQAIILSMGLADQVRRLNNEFMASQTALISNLQGRLEESRARLQLEKENETVMSQLLEKSKQLATTSHDINQPIQSLRLAIEALAVKTDDKDAVSGLQRTIAHMESILGDSLDSASEELRESSARSPQHSVVAGEILRAVKQQFALQAEQQSLQLRAFDSRAVLVTRESALRRCLNNLVSNALHNTRSGGILLGARRRSDHVVFQVLDTGQGIAPEKINSLFDPLAKGEGSSGHGLGLTIVSEICSEFGWKLEVNSEPGRGSCFSIVVPVRGDIRSHIHDGHG